MTKRLRIRAGDVELLARLRDTPTADMLWMQLPVAGRAARWGDEFYFTVPSMMAEREDDARDVMEVGEIGYWVEGQAIAIFFGPTPASRGNEPRAVVPVNVVGAIERNADALARLPDGIVFNLEAAS
ncbi:MAG TPA: cyclophilin-like fold protein [Actinomycetota bacterium]|nr:cyclophilin-like fold protein [Actinomycetota bacterium]